MYLHGLGHFHPSNVIDNDFLGSLDIGLDPDWIASRVGIRERRTVLPLDYIRKERNRCLQAADEASLYSNAQTAARAAQMALTRARLTVHDIGLVISSSSCPQWVSPAESCVAAAELGIERALCFDVNAACSSFAVQLWTLSLMDRRRLPDFILLLQPENLTRAVDYYDRNTAVLMGDASTAAIVSLTVESDIRLDFPIVQCNSERWEHCVIPARGHFRHNGSAVQRFAITKMTETLQALAASVKPNSYFIGHQANLTMLRAVCERAGVPADRHLYNVDRFGNCGCAGPVSVLSEHWDRLGHDDIRIAAVGAGLTWAGMAVHFNRNIQPDYREENEHACARM
jgi:3-oxoacyl-[acyl-carrier-protein] synthase-3